jgi:hypothetical protein
LAFEDHFTRVPNSWARDKRLSRKARGLLLELMSHRVGWDVTLESLVESGTEGRDAVRSAVRELVGLGYLVRARERREDGTLSGVHYDLHDPWSGEPTSGNPTLDDQPTKKTITSEDQLSEDQYPKPTSAGSGRAMSSAQRDFLVDLVLLQGTDADDNAEEYVRGLAATYEEADELIKEYWQSIEHVGRDAAAYLAKSDPALYARLSPRGRAFVDREYFTLSTRGRGAA